MRYQDLVNYLSTIDSKSLPGESAHQALIPLARPLNSQIIDSHEFRSSAVAIYLFEENQMVKSLLIERPEYNGHHSKQIAFPGGKMESTDASLEATARRESWEEIGIPTDSGELITALTPVHIPVSRFTVQPYLFHLNSPPQLRPDPREVQRIIQFDPLQLLRNDKIQLVQVKTGLGVKQNNIPAFQYDAETIIWGATAMILSELKVLVERAKF
jgi:8-oxo-dGTP pyrophosphatase MutT (NUDIX family)